MDYRAIQFQKENKTARITLNRPDAQNAISFELMEDVISALGEVREDPTMKAVVFTGSGKAFSAGADLKAAVSGAFENPKEFQTYLGLFDKMIDEMQEFPLPLIAAVNGFCFAGGLEIMLACDIAIAADGAKIGDQHMNFALIGGPVFWQLFQRIGWQKSAELVYTGKWLTGKAAESYGLVLKAVPCNKLDEEVEELLSQLRDKSRPGLSACKKALKAAREIPTRREAVELGLRIAFQYITTEKEPREGVTAFVEKRKPPVF